jgi:hypothetical protein
MEKEASMGSEHNIKSNSAFGSMFLTRKINWKIYGNSPASTDNFVLRVPQQNQRDSFHNKCFVMKFIPLWCIAVKTCHLLCPHDYEKNREWKMHQA